LERFGNPVTAAYVSIHTAPDSETEVSADSCIHQLTTRTVHDRRADL
jgi:hypothetical protein